MSCIDRLPKVFSNALPAVFLGMVLLYFAGCAPKRVTIPVPVEISHPFSQSGDAKIPDRWWTAFGDKRLNSLVDTALQSNLDLHAAWQRLRAAQAVLGRKKSSLWPGLDAEVTGESSRRSGDSEGEDTLTLGLTSEYELDLWGRLRSAVDARRYEARATFNDYRTAAVSLSAQITVSWFQLVEARRQLELIQKQIETNENVLALLKARFGSGLIRSVDILRQKQLLESTREQKIAMQSRLKVLEHQVAVLLGRPPLQGIRYLGEKLPPLPPVPAAGVPAQLVRRRPDVQSAYNRLQAADRDLAVAVNNRYPRLSLTASLSKNTEDNKNIFKDWIRTLTGNLLAPIFSGGRLNAEVDRTRAVKRQRLFQYGQAVLSAFREVEDGLVREKKQLERIRSIRSQLRLAEQTHTQLRLEYFNGMTAYLDVLTSLDREQQLRRELLSARRVLLEYRVALYRALAGGFETPEENKDRQVKH